MNILKNISPYMLITLSHSENGERQEVSPKDIALRIQNMLRSVSIVISNKRKERSIYYLVVVNTVGRYTFVSLIENKGSKHIETLPI